MGYRNNNTSCWKVTYSFNCFCILNDINLVGELLCLCLHALRSGFMLFSAAYWIGEFPGSLVHRTSVALLLWQKLIKIDRFKSLNPYLQHRFKSYEIKMPKKCSVFFLNLLSCIHRNSKQRNLCLTCHRHLMQAKPVEWLNKQYCRLHIYRFS